MKPAPRIPKRATIINTAVDAVMPVAADPVEVIIVLAAEEPVITLVARDVVVAGEATNPVCRWRAGQPVIIRCAGDLLRPPNRTLVR